MIIRLLKSNNASGFIVLPIVVLAIWAFGFIHPQMLSVRHSMPLYELMAAPLISAPRLAIIISILLLTAEVFLLNYIVNENEVLAKKSNLPALFYIVFMSINSSMLILHPMLLSNLFILFALNKIFNSYRKDIAFSQLFDAGFLISIASLFYFPCIVCVPVLGAALVLFRPFHWREWVIAFLGLLLPYIFITVYYFWNDSTEYLFYDKMFFPMLFKNAGLHPSNSFYVLISLCSLIILFAFGSLFNSISSGAQRTKKALVLMIWLFIFSGLSLFLAPQISAKYFSLLAIPAAVICSNYYLRLKRGFLGEILFILLLIALFTNLLIEIF